MRRDGAEPWDQEGACLWTLSIRHLSNKGYQDGQLWWPVLIHSNSKDWGKKSTKRYWIERERSRPMGRGRRVEKHAGNVSTMQAESPCASGWTVPGHAGRSIPMLASLKLISSTLGGPGLLQSVDSGQAESLPQGSGDAPWIYCLLEG